MKSIQFAKRHTNISDIEIDMIIHAKRSLLFTQGIGTWQKKSGTFDVTMGSYDGAETCEIVGPYLLDKLKEIIPQSNVGLYRDDGLAIITHSNGPKIDKIRKRLHQLFKQEGLKIEVECNKDVVNFLDVTLDINSNCFQPYKKNRTTVYSTYTTNQTIINVLKTTYRSWSIEDLFSYQVVKKCLIQQKRIMKKLCREVATSLNLPTIDSKKMQKIRTENLNNWKVLKPIGEKEQEKEMSRGSIPYFHRM